MTTARVPRTLPSTPRGEVPPLLIPCYFATAMTAGHEVCLLVPSWVVAGPSFAASGGDVTPCAIGLMYGYPEGLPEPATCDMDDRPAVAMDENGTTYCTTCLTPGGDTYGVVQTRFLRLMPFEG